MNTEKKVVVADAYSATAAQTLKVFTEILFGTNDVRVKWKICGNTSLLKCWKRFFGLVASRPVYQGNVLLADTGICEFGGRKWIFYTTCSGRVFLFDPSKETLLFIHDESSYLKGEVEAIVGERKDVPVSVADILNNVSYTDIERSGTVWYPVPVTCPARHLIDVINLLKEGFSVQRIAVDVDFDDRKLWQSFQKGKRCQVSEEILSELNLFFS